MSTKKNLLTIPDAAARLGASRATIYRLVAEGQLDYVPIGGGSRAAIRIVEDSIDAYIDRMVRVGRKTGRKLGPQRPAA